MIHHKGCFNLWYSKNVRILKQVSTIYFKEPLQLISTNASLYNWFFIEYWIKTGLDFYPGPFFILIEYDTIKNLISKIFALITIPQVISSKK